MAKKSRGGAPKKLIDPVAYRVNVERIDLESLNALAEARGVPAMALMRRALRQFLRRNRVTPAPTREKE